jgi:glycosyltransferase-like protein
MSGLSVAMLTYSLRPRGGVVHALEVSEALAGRGHRVELFALGRPGERFFREPAVPVQIVRHEPRDGPFDERVWAMLAAYRDGLAGPLADGCFDVIHAQDCLSANAALELRELGLVPHVLRTVHHVDDFSSPSLVECQERSIVGPDAVLCVSEPWIGRLAAGFGVQATCVTNGVDPRRFRAPRSAAERRSEREALGIDGRLAVLTVGGIEPRKGSLTLVEAFARLRELAPDLDPLLIVAGGATLFDYRDELARFEVRAAELGVDAEVWRLGNLADRELERLYRVADIFAFPSVKEGFGLAALEALASGLPVAASDLEAFRSFLVHDRTALLAPVGDSEALAAALARLARRPELRERLRGGVGGMAEFLEVSAAWQGGYRTVVDARGHEFTVDEPESAGGGNTGMMPTEVFLASVASCYCLALAFAASKRSLELPGLEVTVRAERAGTELRYRRLAVEAKADVPDERLAGLIDPARRVCWVSNTLAGELELDYGYTSVDARPSQ